MGRRRCRVKLPHRRTQRPALGDVAVDASLGSSYVGSYVTVHRWPRLAPLVGALSLLASVADGQGRGIEVTYGRWWHGGPAALYGASLYRPLAGLFDLGYGITHVEDQGVVDGSQSGVELLLGVGRSGSGPYAVTALGLGVRHGDGAAAALWSAGGGYAWRPLPLLSLGLEARYRVEDRDVHGFWRLQPDDRRGLSVQARVALGFAGRTRRAATKPRREPLAVPAGPAIADAGRAGGASADAALLAAAVVETALDVMGTPYRWGGNDADGYDCSGLIQYAYGQHGILLPRVSRDQARLGLAVDRTVGALRPGDILTFAVSGGGVSHVGLYVGDGTFIHSASTGVKLGSLTSDDPESRWWQARWAGARRILE